MEFLAAERIKYDEFDADLKKVLEIIEKHTLTNVIAGLSTEYTNRADEAASYGCESEEDLRKIANLLDAIVMDVDVAVCAYDNPCSTCNG